MKVGTQPMVLGVKSSKLPKGIDPDSEPKQMLGELAATAQARTNEFRSRKGRYNQRTFRKDEAEYALAEGWELVRENTNTDRYQKIKSHDEQLENEIWCLMYNFG